MHLNYSKKYHDKLKLMSVTYDTLLNDTQLIQYIASSSNTSLYPDSNTIAITGPIWLPRIYGKDLTAFEIASSGKIAISLNDIHTVDISRSNYVDSNNFKNTITSQSNYSLDLVANAGDLSISLDAYSNNLDIYAASNMSLTANSGNLSITTSNDFTVSVSNSYAIVTNSNITMNAANGSVSFAANDSNMYVSLDQSTNNISVYTSNSIGVSACNSYNMSVSSNVTVGALAGDVKLYSDSSNMYVTMTKSTDTIAVYSSNNVNIVASNSVGVTSLSNIAMGALSGDFKVYSDASNMFLTMDSTVDDVTLFASNDLYLSSSNTMNVNAQSNILVGAKAGDLKLYSQGSNMYMTMTAATNNVAVFASNNLTVSVSNSLTEAVNSNISVSTVAGDYRLYVNSSNMFMRMSATTNNISIFSSNNTTMSASNNFSVAALSNMTFSTSNGELSLSANSSNMYFRLDSATNDVTLFSSNNTQVSASNDFYLNANSNIYLGALAGSFKTYADASNMYFTMDKATDTVTLYTASNMYVSASNTYYLNAKSNIYIGALNGDLKLYASSSNMYLVMDKATNNINEYTASNLNVSVSNNYTTTVKSNLTFTTVAGDVNLSVNSSNMYLIMNHTSNDVTLFTSNNYTIGVSNNFDTMVNSNYNITTVAGSFDVFANSSNMYLTMDYLTNDVTIFSSNNTNIYSSNDVNMTINSNYNINTVAGSYQLNVNSTSMSLVMDASTDNTTLFTSNNLQITASNNMYVNVKSNIYVGALRGDLKLYANGSNMYVTMDRATNNLAVYASNNVNETACNNFYVNALSNIYVGALNGDYKVYSMGSNMYLTMDSTVNDVSIFASNNLNISASNNFNVDADSNVSINATSGDMKLYANLSNMFVTMDHTSNNLAIYASNNINLTASNSYSLVTRSNVSVSASLGSLKLYSATSNMYLVMDAATRNTTQYTSNNLGVSVSNDYNLNVQSNIYIGALAGDFKTYANGSNMYLTMEVATDNTTLYTSNDMYLSASNTLYVNTQSNIYVGALAGSLKAYADSSNMYVTMDRSTDNISVYAASNINVVSSNTMNIQTKSNLYVGALSGDVKLYSSASNMYLTMDHTTSNIAVYAGGQVNLTACNEFNATALSNVNITSTVKDIALSSSNNTTITACNDIIETAQSNVILNAINGNFAAYSMNSNMSIVMDSTTNNMGLFASNDMNVSVSNNFNLFVQSNIAASANKGDVKIYANSSNMSLVMDRATNNTSLYTSNNLLVTTSNSASIVTYSNVSVSASLGSLKLYSATSNMSLVMDAATRNTTQYTSNNLGVSVSNDYNLNVQSNIYIGALAGDFKTYADGSNMYLTMEVATDNTTLYTSNDMYLSASNILYVNTQSNVYIGALAGSLKAYADSSNMYMIMDDTTDNVTVFASNNVYVSASNDMNLNASSNINVGALNGSVKLYSHASNISVVLDNTTDNINIYASNNINTTASNDFTLNAKSNVTINAVNNNFTVFASNNFTVTASNDYVLNARSNITEYASKGSWSAYANNSNMYLIMDQPTNVVSLYGLKDMNLTSSNTFTLNAQSNVLLNANNGEMLAYASSNLKLTSDASNMYIHMAMPSDVISMYSLSNIALSASNNMFLDAMSNISMTASNFSLLANRNFTLLASNDITITASNQLILNFGSTNASFTIGQNSAFTAESNFNFFIQSASNPSEAMFSIRNSDVLIRGDIIVTGSINTSNVFSTTVIQESLKVSDKEVTLASVGSNFDPGDGPTDGIANNGAGIVVDGKPAGYDSNIPEAYDKTFKWNYGTSGIGGLGTAAGLSNESFWEVKGGSFHLTHQKIVPAGGSNIVQDVTMIMRINENDELEICKKWWYTASNAYVTKRVAKFGKIL